MTKPLTLCGLRVLNTRPIPQSHHLDLAIRHAGGQSIPLPAFALEPTSTAWQEQVPSLKHLQYAIFTSANAVYYFYSSWQQSWPAHVHVIAIGNATKDALLTWGISVDGMPAIADSEHLLQLHELQHVTHQSILLIKGEGGRMMIPQTLKQRGATLVSLEVYRRIFPHANQELIRTLWQEEAVDIILFTSELAIHHTMTLLGNEATNWFCRTPCLVISERLAQVARAVGIQTVITCSYDTLLNALKGFVHDRS